MWLFLNGNDIYDPLNLVVLRFFRLVGCKKYTLNGIHVERRKYTKTAKFTKFT